jgi:hypothetical protein
MLRLILLWLIAESIQIDHPFFPHLVMYCELHLLLSLCYDLIAPSPIIFHASAILPSCSHLVLQLVCIALVPRHYFEQWRWQWMMIDNFMWQGYQWRGTFPLIHFLLSPTEIQNFEKPRWDQNKVAGALIYCVALINPTKVGFISTSRGGRHAKLKEIDPTMAAPIRTLDPQGVASNWHRSSVFPSE